MAGIYVCSAMCRVSIVLDIFLIYVFAIAIREASIITTPNNKALIAGQRMEMECRTDNESMFRKWNFLPVASDSLQTIVTNDNTNIEVASTVSGFGVHIDQNGSVILYSNSTMTNNAGVYICQGETGSTEFKFSAQLVVFESEPICETNLTASTTLSDADYIWMQCTVNFRGNWAPTMEWRQHTTDGGNDEGRPVMNGTDTVVVQNSSITSTLIVLIDPTNNESYYSCRTYFTWHNGKLRTNASNKPDFSHTWILNSTSNFIARPTTSGSKGTTAHQLTTVNPDHVLLLFGVLSVAFFLMMMATVAICCVIIRKKTAEWMAKVASTYDNRNRPRSLRNSRRFSSENLHNRIKAISLNEVQVTFQCPEKEPSEGYTSVDDLTEECNQAMDDRPTTSKIPKYTSVNRNKPGDKAARGHYSLAMEDPLLYATLRKDIEPPKWDNMNADTDSESDSVDLK